MKLVAALFTALLRWITTAGIAHSSSMIALWGDSYIYGCGTDVPFNPDCAGKMQHTIGIELKKLSGVETFSAGYPGETSSQILAHIKSDTSHRGLTTILWMGHNNFTQPERIKADIAAAVDTIGSGRVLVLGITNDDGTPIGAPNYAIIRRINADLSATYGEAFFDVLAYLASTEALNDAGITATPIDRENISQGIIPLALRSEGVHLNTVGYQVLTVKIWRRLGELGWLSR